MNEKEYRNQVSRLFKKLEVAFDTIDPDSAEYEYSQGSVVIHLAGGAKCILSTQPSVHQVWVAAASKGLGLHFNYESATDSWLDDKSKGIELTQFLRNLILETTGIELKI